MKLKTILGLGLLLSLLTAALVFFTNSPESPPPSVRPTKSATPRADRPMAAIPAPTFKDSEESSKEISLLADPTPIDPASNLAIESMELLSIIKANQSELNLTPAEVARIVNTFKAYLDLKAETEAKLIHQVSLDGGLLRLVIPPHPNDADALKEGLFGEIASDVSDEHRKQTMDVLGPFLDSYFKYYGRLGQSFEIKPSSNASSYKLAWEVSSDVAGSRNAPGDTAPYVRLQMASGTAGFTAEGVATTQYKHFAPYIAKAFSTSASSPPP